MKLSRKWILVAALVMSVAMATSGTLAYLTDRDSEVNVFTFGNVDIELNEEFTQGATLTPGVDVEKDVVIENTGKNEAWVWATIAIPQAMDDNDASKNVLHFNYNKDYVNADMWTWKDDKGAWLVKEGVQVVESDPILYNVYTVLYQTALKPGETTPSAMTKVYLDFHIDIDPDGNMYHVENGVVTDLKWNVNDNGTPTMYVAAYAIQKEGFDTVQDAYAAYNTQWGDNGGVDYDSYAVANNAEELVGHLEDVDDGFIIVKDDISGEDMRLTDGNVKIVLNGNTLEANLKISAGASMEIEGGSMGIMEGAAYADAINNSGDLTVKDVTLNAGSNADYGIIGQAGSNTVLENVNYTSAGGGVGAQGGAQVVFEGGSVAVNTSNTSPRYNFYATGEGTTITINDGTFSFSHNTNKRSYIYAGAGATVYVNGGTFGPACTRADYPGFKTAGTGKVIVTGGTFGFDPTTWVAEGYQAMKTGDVWVVSAK